MKRSGRREPPDEGRTPTGLTLGGGFLVVVVTALTAAPSTHAAGPRIGALTAAVLLFTAVAGDGSAAVGTAVIAWAVGNGFLINQRGELSWHSPVDNWFVMGLLGAVAVGMTAAQIRGGARRRRRWRPLRELLEAATEWATGPAGESRDATGAPPRSAPR